MHAAVAETKYVVSEVHSGIARAEIHPVGVLLDYMSRLLDGDPEVATGGPADCRWCRGLFPSG
jgi:hypothetical protein